MKDPDKKQKPRPEDEDLQIIDLDEVSVPFKFHFESLANTEQYLDSQTLTSSEIQNQSQAHFEKVIKTSTIYSPVDRQPIDRADVKIMVQVLSMKKDS